MSKEKEMKEKEQAPEQDNSKAKAEKKAKKGKGEQAAPLPVLLEFVFSFSFFILLAVDALVAALSWSNGCTTTEIFIRVVVSTIVMSIIIFMLARSISGGMLEAAVKMREEELSKFQQSNDLNA